MSSKLSKSKIFLILLISFILGVFLANFYKINFLIHIFISILLVVDIALILKNKLLLVFLGCIVSILFGYLYFNNYLNKITPTDIAYDQRVEFEAVVDDYPDEREDEIKYILKVTDSENKSLVGQRILITYSKFPKYSFSDKLLVSSTLTKPEKFEDFDYPRFLAKDRIFALAYSSQYDEDYLKIEKITNDKDEFNIKKSIFSFRDLVYLRLKSFLSEPHSGVVSAITLGLKKAIPENFLEKLRSVGVSHIVVISGFHVAVILKILIDSSLNLSRKLVFISGSLFLLFFVIFTGAGASVIRASIMVWLFLLAKIIGRKGKMLNVLVFTIFVMILFNPLILASDVSFQLSVCAVFGLIYLQPIFEKWFSNLPKFFVTILSATFAAQVATLGISMYQFGTVSVIAPISNIIIVPIVPFIMLFGYLSIFSSFIFLKLGQVFAYVVWIFTSYLKIVTDYLSQIPFAQNRISFDSFYYPLVYYLILIALVFIYYNYPKINKKIRLLKNAKQNK